MFYKNVIFVMPLFFYGFVSVFSGISFYEAFLYQSFNIFYTSWPPLYYAVFDFQFRKEEFTKDPKYYKIGFKDECFNKWVFARWIIYAVLYGALAVFVGFETMEIVNNDTGETLGSVMSDGQFVYTCIVTLVNLKILTNAHNFTFYNFFFSIGSILCFVLFYYLLTLWPGEILYMEFSSVFRHSMFIFALFFCGAAMLVMDNGLHLA